MYEYILVITQSLIYLSLFIVSTMNGCTGYKFVYLLSSYHHHLQNYCMNTNRMSLPAIV